MPKCVNEDFSEYDAQVGRGAPSTTLLHHANRPEVGRQIRAEQIRVGHREIARGAWLVTQSAPKPLAVGVIFLKNEEHRLQAGRLRLRHAGDGVKTQRSRAHHWGAFFSTAHFPNSRVRRARFFSRIRPCPHAALRRSAGAARSGSERRSVLGRRRWDPAISRTRGGPLR